MNLYETKTVLAAIEQIKPANKFLRMMFFPEASDQTLLSEDVLIDSKKGKRKVAPFVAPKVGGVVVDREGFITNKITAPRIAPERALTIDDLNRRSLGENIVSTKTPAQREASLLGKDIAELKAMTDRRMELMIRDLLFTGVINVKGYVDAGSTKTVDQVIDYGINNKFPIKTLWNLKEANIFADLKDMRKEIVKNSGINPNILVVSSDVIDVLLDNEKFMKLMDTKNVNVGAIDPKILEGGANYWGRLTALGLDIFSYDEWYLDENEEEQSMVPEGTILMGSKAAGNMRFGLVTQIEKDGVFSSYEGRYIPKIWANIEADIKKIRLTTRPVPVPTYLDSWAIAKVK